MGVHVFDGKTWQFQNLYQRNIDEDRYYPDTWPRGTPKPPEYHELRRFSGPTFSEDSQGRVYIWTSRGYGAEAGTIGFWVYDHGTWKNVDDVDHLFAVIPRDPDETWLVSRGPQANPVAVHQISTLSVIKGGLPAVAGNRAALALGGGADSRVRGRGHAGAPVVYLGHPRLADGGSRRQELGAPPGAGWRLAMRRAWIVALSRLVCYTGPSEDCTSPWFQPRPFPKEPFMFAVRTRWFGITVVAWFVLVCTAWAEEPKPKASGGKEQSETNAPGVLPTWA